MKPWRFSDIPPRGSLLAFGIMRKPRACPRITLDAEGFGVEEIEGGRLHWADVRRITTHKLDLLTSDEVRLVLRMTVPSPRSRCRKSSQDSSSSGVFSSRSSIFLTTGGNL